jgi:hypothetical protein
MKQMNYFKMMLAGALVVALASCGKENFLPEDQNGLDNKGAQTVKLGIQMEPGTKVVLSDENKFSWEKGDKIGIWIGDSGKDEAGGFQECEIVEEGSNKQVSVNLAKGNRYNYAVYPYNGNHSYDIKTGSLIISLPDSYYLSEVTDTKTPLPMVAINDKKSNVLTFYNVGGMLRLTVNNIPASTKRLEIGFDGKKVCGDFTIESEVAPGKSTIATTEDPKNDIITITKDGSDETLGQTSLVLNIPLPLGEYTNAVVVAYDAIKDGEPLKLGDISIKHKAERAGGLKKTVSLDKEPVTFFKFRFQNKGQDLKGLRFVRLFSNQNKLHNGATTYGPYTVSSDVDFENPVSAQLLIDQAAEDILAFQVVAADGKVYSANYKVPADGFKACKSYELTVDVNTYTFTVASGKKVYFSPGDLGVDNGVYSFTEPFTTWAHGNTSNINRSADAPAKRVWFDWYYDSGLATGTVYGINNWRVPNRAGNNTASYEWNYLIASRTMNSDVKSYYKVTISSYEYCLLLPPDETESSDIGEDLTSGKVTDYAKYLGKGFVLLFNTNRGTYSKKWSWAASNSNYYKQGFYWTVYNSSNRYYFTWPSSGNPSVDWGMNRMRNHIRYIRNAE